jgi:Uma2 family endonuclease
MSPIGSFHGSVVARLIRVLGKLANDRWLIWAQTSIRLDEHSEPEPDIALVRPSPDDYASRHPGPGDIFLIVEVSDSSLNFDRGTKLSLYGRAGINEVWIVNLVNSVVEVYREPNFTGYGSKTILRSGSKADVLAFPDVTVDVADLLKR